MSINIIPLPGSLKISDGKFTLTPHSCIAAVSVGAGAAAELLAEYLRKSTGFALKITDKAVKGDIVLAEEGCNTPDESGFFCEKYTLKVTSDNIFINGASSIALLRGVQTLRQLFPADIYSEVPVGREWAAEGVEIVDEPAYRWRGIMIDVARHFFTKVEVCRMIELAAQFKYSVVHLHLTDDQGWRVEIKRYPRLTEIGSVRKRTMIGHYDDRPRKYDHTPYGGFFTQDDLREIVDFASCRGIMLVPEIDMPGHMCAAIAAYPELGNYPQHQLEVRDCWGISYQILSPRKSTIEFMQNVLSEIMDIFPGRFIHVGGDEARKDEWAICHEAQEIMAEHNCCSEHELQSYFILQMSEFIGSRGRRMIGWSEIMDGGLAEGAAIMSWQDMEAGKKAAAMHHDVVMAPAGFTYLNFYQADPATEPLAIGGDIPIEKVYRYKPAADDMPENDRKYVIGGQGQLWSEYIDRMPLWEYQAFPRACALAEKLWTAQDKCCYVDFLQRLKSVRDMLNVQHVNACMLP